MHEELNAYLRETIKIVMFNYYVLCVVLVK